MRVQIDGIEYVPVRAAPQDNSMAAALEVRFDSYAGKTLSVREYLHELFTYVWQEREGFHELYVPLVKAGFLSGSVDTDDYLETINEDEAHQYIQGLIDTIFSKMGANAS